MNWFGLGRWNIERASRPWGDRPSILHFLESARRDELGNPPDLPDDERASSRGIRWAAGAADGVGTHHMGRNTESDPAGPLWAALADVVNEVSDERVARLYELASKESMAGLADAIVAKVRAETRLDRSRMQRVARWLVREAADREPVKLGIAVLGVIGDAEDRPGLDRLARHDEFTLFAVVALVNLDLLTWVDLWEVAKDVHGWGRIQVVERLTNCDDPRIRRWLVREGFRNSVMDEYLACICADRGDLAGELAEPSPDPALLTGAAGILVALADTTSGGPSAGFEAYDRGVEAATAFLRHAALRRGTLDLLLASERLRKFVEDDDADWPSLASAGWTEAKRSEIATLAREVIERPEWAGIVQAGTSSEAPEDFPKAVNAAGVLGIDVWEAVFDRLTRDRDHADWFRACATDDPERIDRVIAFAERSLPLDEIASGPASEMGMGPAWNHHRDLGVVLQHLQAFPGRGWRLIEVGLRSPLTWDRNMALRALAAWARADWPSDALSMLEAAQRQEPEERTRQNIERLLAGEPLV